MSPSRSPKNRARPPASGPGADPSRQRSAERGLPHCIGFRHEIPNTIRNQGSPRACRADAGRGSRVGRVWIADALVRNRSRSEENGSGALALFSARRRGRAHTVPARPPEVTLPVGPRYQDLQAPRSTLPRLAGLPSHPTPFWDRPAYGRFKWFPRRPGRSPAGSTVGPFENPGLVLVA